MRTGTCTNLCTTFLCKHFYKLSMQFTFCKSWLLVCHLSFLQFKAFLHFKHSAIYFIACLYFSKFFFKLYSAIHLQVFCKFNFETIYFKPIIWLCRMLLPFYQFIRFNPENMKMFSSILCTIHMSQDLLVDPSCNN